jgi:hypothetical protein
LAATKSSGSDDGTCTLNVAGGTVFSQTGHADAQQLGRWTTYRHNDATNGVFKYDDLKICVDEGITGDLGLCPDVNEPL